PLHYAAGGPPVALRAPPAPGPAPAGSEPPLLAPAGHDRGALQRGGSAPPDDALVDRRVLVVDDDVRNIFAMSSVLERHGMQVITAGNGQDAIARVSNGAAVDLVLMDIMMPGMDGYETMRAIRQLPALRTLPIIAITAKAMK